MKSLLILGAVLLLVLVPTNVGATVPPPPAWKASFPTSVTYGDFLSGQVSGPVNGTFLVNVSGQPFNTSAPFFHHVFTFAANKSSTNVSIPTSDLTLGEFDLQIFTTTNMLILNQYFHVLDPINVTQLNNELYQIEQELLALQGQIQGIAATESNLFFHDRLLLWVFFTLFAVLLLKEVLMYLVYRYQFSWRKLRQSWKEIWFAPAIRNWSGDIPIAEVITRHVNPERRFVSGFCDDCKTLRLEAEVIQHLMTKHGRLEPQLGRDYWEVKPDYIPRTEGRDRRLKHPNFVVD